jgi:Flp pilus assembly protein TadG
MRSGNSAHGSRHRSARRGAVLAEAAIVIFVFLILVFGMMDLGIGVARNNALSQAARQGVRQALVHGRLAPSGWNGGAWGSTALDIYASADHPVANVVRPMLSGSDPSTTNIHIEWPDGSNEVGKQVRVTLATTYTPMLFYLFGGATLNLNASATMPIAH